MEKSTKLNGPIRAFLKSKAKEKLEGRGSVKVRQLTTDRTKVLEQIESLPDVRIAVSEYRKALKRRDEIHKAAQVWREKLKAMTGIDYGDYGGVSYVCSKGGTNLKAVELARQYDAIGDEIKRARECHCHVGDSPELLEFVAQLSLCKTVGDAEKLLGRLN